MKLWQSLEKNGFYLELNPNKCCDAYQSVTPVYSWEWSMPKLMKAKNDSVFLGVRGRDKVAGFAVVRRQYEGELELDYIYTFLPYRKMGIARGIFELISKIWTNAEAMFFEVSERNSEALKFYKSLGAYKLGTRRHYYGANHHGINMKMPLKRLKSFIK